MKNKEELVINNNKFIIYETEGGYWLANCPSLELTFQAETREELMEDIDLTLKAIKVDLEKDKKK